MKKISENWDRILSDLSCEEFDIEFFQQTLKESFDVVYKKVSENKMDVEVKKEEVKNILVVDLNSKDNTRKIVEKLVK